jgi:hypothetical protein
MDYDRLTLFDTALVPRITAMDDDQLWKFLLENEERIKFLTSQDLSSSISPVSGFFYAYPHGIDWFKKHFLQHLEDYREGVIFTIVMDFCFKDENAYLDYYARCGYLDNEDSCGVKTSDEIMPPVDEDSEEGYHKKYFHLLEPSHVENIIQAMEKNFGKLEKNTREDIDKIKRMKKFCLENEGYRVAYIYDI